MTTRDCEVVAALGQAITQCVGEPRYQLWFAGKTKFHWTDEQLVVGVPNHFYQEWLQTKFADAVGQAAELVLGRTLQVRFAIDPELFQAARQAQAAVEARPASAPPAPPTPKPAAAPKATRTWHRLDDFVIGPCNRVAHAAALSVVENPAQDGNPLVLHGAVGTGKTHLLEGIYLGLRRRHPEWRVCFTTAEDFTNRFLNGLRLGKLGSFRKQYRECDALLVDDLHFLATKRATHEEFLHTFNAVVSAGKQVVITCDCHPRLSEDFNPELADRLLGGVVWGLAPPDEATRLEILRAKSAAVRAPVPPEVLAYVARQLRGNVRELSGALHSVLHYARVTGRPVDLPLAREALSELLRHAVRVVQLADVDRAVCQVFRLPDRALQSAQRTWAVSHPRMVAIYVARKHTSAAYSEIGRFFGGRNHSTAVAAEKKVRQWLQEDADMYLGDRPVKARELVELVERELRR